MKAEKHGNGYRVRKMYNGKTYTAYFDHKPSSKEIVAVLSSLMEGSGASSKGKGNVREAAEKYINDRREHGLSPSTLIGYKSSLRNTPDWFLKMNAFDVEQRDIEKLISEYSKKRSGCRFSRVQPGNKAAHKAAMQMDKTEFFMLILFCSY